MINNILKAVIICAMTTSCTTKFHGSKAGEQTDETIILTQAQTPEKTSDADPKVIKCKHLDGMVKLTALIVAYPKIKIDESRAKSRSKPLSTAALIQLLNQGDGRIIASPGLVTKSRYETASEVRTSSSKESPSLTPNTMLKDSRDFGIDITFRYTPDLIDDGEVSYVNANIFLEILEPSQIVSTLSTDNAFTKQYKIQTFVTLQDEQTMMIAGGVSNKNSEEIYVFLTCNILNPETPSSKIVNDT